MLISIDTLRADRLPAYGYARGSTPALDGLARDGVLFERAYSHSPQTLPAHASMLTGQLPFEHAVRDNIGFALGRDVPTLAEAFRARGYNTGAFVSSYVLRREVGLDRGFETYDSDLPVASPEMSFGQVQRDGRETLARARAWLDVVAPRNWFLFLHLYEPHKPYAPPPQHAHLSPYDGDVAYADEIVGNLLDDLRKRGLYDAATIVVVGDHGEGLGDHGEQEHGVFLYNDTTWIPLIVKLPGQRSAGRRVAAPVQHIDLMPTLLALVNVPAKAGLRGRSLVPVLESADGKIAEQGVYAESLYPRYHFGWSELYSLTDGRYRYIRAPRDELYDLQDDAGERRNLAEPRHATRQAMRSALEALIAGRAVDQPSAVSAEDRERLAALGYVGASTQTTSATSPGDALADPKDRIKTLEKYRHAVDLAGSRSYADAMALFREILVENPAMKDVWHQLANVATRAGRFDEALSAYRRLVEIDPSEPNGLLGVAAVQLRRREFTDAASHAEMAARLARPDDIRARASAYELLTKMALVRKDGVAARRYAQQAQEIDPTLPLPAYVQGRMAHAAGRYEEAARFFADAAANLRGRSVTIAELHFYLGDALARLERTGDAERAFREELRLFPQSAQVYSALAMLYRATGRDADVERTIADLLRQLPTAEGYDLAARLWTIFGEPQRAKAVQAAGARHRAAGR